MKKHFQVIITIFICFVTCFFNTVVVNAATAEELKERWYDTRYYPLYNGSEEWQKHDFFDTLDILNPPLDLLLSMSTKELAELMQEYPLMWQMNTYFDTDGNQDYITFFCFIEINCDIFYELLRREDGITCLLEEYRTHELDMEKLNEDGAASAQMWDAEKFGCQFIRYYAHHFTDSEYALASQIIEEKKELYSLLDDRFLYYVDLPEIEPPTGEKVSDIRTNYLSLEEIWDKEDQLAAALPQEQSKENGLQTKRMIVVGAIIGLVCVAGGFVFIRRRRKGNH